MPRENRPVHGEETTAAASFVRGEAHNDSTAWERLVVTYSPLVYTWSRRSGLQPSCASDVVQDVLRDVARKIKDFHQDQHGYSFRRWLRRLTQFRIADLRDREGRDGGRLKQQHSIADASFTEPLALLIAEGKQQVLATVQAEFSDRNWQIFWSIVVEDREPAEAAEAFGVTLNVVQLAKSRILERLRDRVKQLESRQ